MDQTTSKVIDLLSSIANTLSEFGNENKGVSEFIEAKGNIESISQIVNDNLELSLQQKAGMMKLTNFLNSEIDKKLAMFNNT